MGDLAGRQAHAGSASHEAQVRERHPVLGVEVEDQRDGQPHAGHGGHGEESAEQSCSEGEVLRRRRLAVRGVLAAIAPGLDQESQHAERDADGTEEDAQEHDPRRVVARRVAIAQRVHRQDHEAEEDEERPQDAHGARERSG